MVLADYGEWVFATGGGDSEGFNDAALDTFQGHRVQSMVREVIQNSADARADRTPSQVLSGSTQALRGSYHHVVAGTLKSLPSVHRDRWADSMSANKT